MKTITSFFFADPIKVGAKVISDSEVVDMLKSESKELPVLSPFAKTVGFVLNSKGYKKAIYVKGKRRHRRR